MHPVLVELGPRAIGTYGVMVALGIGVAWALVARAAARAGMDVPRVLALSAIATAGGFAGSWMAFVLVEVARGGEPWRGGLVFFGAVPGGLGAALAAGRWLGVDTLALLDRSVPGLAAGHALGRVGCFFGGCCHGRPFDGPWAVTLGDPPLGRHPTPLYEAAGVLAIATAFALAPLRGRRASPALAYLAAYCVLRIAVELTRGDAARGVWLGVSTSQIVAAIGLAGAAAVAARRARD